MTDKAITIDYPDLGSYQITDQEGNSIVIGLEGWRELTEELKRLDPNYAPVFYKQVGELCNKFCEFCVYKKYKCEIDEGIKCPMRTFREMCALKY